MPSILDALHSHTLHSMPSMPAVPCPPFASVTTGSYTSKTCCKCLGPCGPWVEVENKKKKERDKKISLRKAKMEARGSAPEAIEAMEEKMKKVMTRVRGLRVCQDESCRLPQNRDRTGAINIGTQFARLFDGEGPIRAMSDEERELHRLRVALAPCAECDDE